MDQGRIPPIPIFLDSPMAVSGMNIYRYYASEHDLSEGLAVRADFEFDVDRVQLARSVGRVASRSTSCTGPAVIISSSGMMTGGRILHHLRQRLPDARNTIVLGGFMAAGTRGRALQEGATLAARLRRRRAGAGGGGRDVGSERARRPLGAAALAGTARCRRDRCFLTHGELASATALAEDLAPRPRLEHAGAQDGPARRIGERPQWLIANAQHDRKASHDRGKSRGAGDRRGPPRGQRLAHALAAHGYRLALHASGSLGAAQATADELTAGGCESIALAADLRDEGATRKMIAAARDSFGRIDALVNNAAMWISKPLEEVRAADVRAQFEINTLATFICCQEAGLAMVAQPTGGAIVNVGDWATVRPYVDYSAYFVAKGSIPTLTRVLAVELASRNPRVRVNAVLPGPVLFPDNMSQEERAAVIGATLVKRPGSPEDLAHAVLFLLENTFVTGVCLPVDGGRTIYTPAGDD